MNRLNNTTPKSSNKQTAKLLGVGLDHHDGHKRLTQSERFAIVGGSEETHQRMTETVVKTFETLDRKGKDLDSVEKGELKDIIQASTPK
ncbi:MAG: hypothetical protein EA353_07760 [Puniceicoccaceae bacterium]|nr:MAG: hypothetical protein EA353_07760 [Puniceicoccaceae bacterium]